MSKLMSFPPSALTRRNIRDEQSVAGALFQVALQVRSYPEDGLLDLKPTT